MTAQQLALAQKSGKTYDRVEKEFLNTTAVVTSGLVVSIQTPLHLRRRKIYAFLQVKVVHSGLPWMLAGEVRLLQNGVPISQPLPICTAYLANDVTIEKSLSSAFLGFASTSIFPTGTPDQDSMMLALSKPQQMGVSHPSSTSYYYSVSLLPFNLDCEIDTIEMHLTNSKFVSNMTGIRAYVCCVSQ